MKKNKLLYINKEQTSGFSHFRGATISFAGSAVSDVRLPETVKDMVNSENPEVSDLLRRLYLKITL